MVAKTVINRGALQRIINDSTNPEANKRIYVGDILSRLRFLQQATQKGIVGAPIEIVAENLIFAICADNYEVNASGTIFTRSIDGYRTYSIEACKKLTP